MRGVLDTTLCDKVCQGLAACRWVSPSASVSSTNKTDWHDIVELLLHVALNTIHPTHKTLLRVYAILMNLVHHYEIAFVKINKISSGTHSTDIVTPTWPAYVDLFYNISTGPAWGSARPNCCKTCRLLCVLEQPRVDARPSWEKWVQLE